MKKFFLFLAVAFAFLTNAHAAFPPNTTEWKAASYLQWVPTLGQSCSDLGIYLNDPARLPVDTLSFAVTICEPTEIHIDRYLKDGRHLVSHNILYPQARTTCPPNSTLVNGQCVCAPDTNELNGQCNPQCPAGAESSGDYWIGYADPNTGEPIDDTATYGASLPGTTACKAGCTVMLGVPTNVFSKPSEPLENGYERTYASYPEITLGSTCTDADDPPPPGPPPVDPPPAGGDPTDPPDGPDCPDGSDTCEGDGPGGGDDGDGPGDGNPGDGGSGGGTGGGSGGGTGEDAGNCGGSGQVACRVKVDETGTPDKSTANTAFKNAEDELKTFSDGFSGKIQQVLDTVGAPNWTWTFQLPTGCTPYQLPQMAMTIDVCQFQPMIHDLMSLLWASAGIFGLMALFRSAIV